MKLSLVLIDLFFDKPSRWQNENQPDLHQKSPFLTFGTSKPKFFQFSSSKLFFGL